MRRAMLCVVTALVVLCGLVSSASANSVGQCNVRQGNTIKSLSEWRSVLKAEGVTSQAKKIVFRKAGFHITDQSFKQWMKHRVMRGKAARQFSARDYGCRAGRLFGVGTRHYAKGKGIFFVLSRKYSKSDVSMHPKKGYKKKLAKVLAIGLEDCGNPVLGHAKVWLWVKKHHRRPKPPETPPAIPTPPAPTPAPPVPPTPVPTPVPPAPPAPQPPEKPQKPEKPDWPHRPDKPKPPEHPDHPGKPEQPQPPDKPDHPDHPDHPGKPCPPDQPQHPQKPDYPDHPGKPHGGYDHPQGGYDHPYGSGHHYGHHGGK